MGALRRQLPRAPLGTWLGGLVGAALIATGLFLVVFSGYCEDSCTGRDWSMVRMGVTALVLAAAALVLACRASAGATWRRAILPALVSLVLGAVVIGLTAAIGMGLVAWLLPDATFGDPSTLLLLGLPMVLGVLWWVGATARLARRGPDV